VSVRSESGQWCAATQAGPSRRELLAGGAAARALAWSSRAAAVPAGTDANYADIDPELIDDLRLLAEMEVDADNLLAFRHRPPARHAHPLPPSSMPAKPDRRSIPGLAGEPPVTVLVLDLTRERRERPAVVWMHGGGFVAGGAGIPAPLVAAAAEHGWLIVSVDYRLAPEAHYPAALNDNYAALRWVHDNAAALCVDRSRIAVGGASAGGGHAAMLALAARDRREVPVAYQILIYPMLDDRTGSTRPAPAGTGHHVWTARSNRFGWSALLGQPAGTANVPAGVVPGRRSDLAGLPPAFIGAGTLDLFVAEDIAYATALAAAGVKVDLAVVPAAYHAFDGVAPLARVSREFTARWIGDLRAALA